MYMHKLGIRLGLVISILVGTSVPVLAATNGATLSVVPAPAGPVVRAVQQPVLTEQRFQAGPDEYFELLFSDGTSVTLAPGSALTVERFTWDGTSGDLAIQLERGTFRISGGALGRNEALAVGAADGTVSLQNASAIVVVGEGGFMRAYMLAGDAVVVTSGGNSVRLVRPMYETVITGAGEAPSTPERVNTEQVRADAVAINPQFQAGEAQGEPAANLTVADLERPEVTEPGGTTQPSRTTLGSVDGNSGYGPGQVGVTGDLNQNLGSISDDGQVILTQSTSIGDQDPSGFADFILNDREKGPTANRLYQNGSTFTQIIDPDPISILGPDAAQYKLRLFGTIILGDLGNPETSLTAVSSEFTISSA